MADVPDSVRPEFSRVYHELDACGRKRYVEKLSLVGQGVRDPYLHKPSEENAEPVFVPVEYGDVYKYLINAPSPYTKEDLKAFKSLDGYQFFLAGWIGELQCFNATSDGSRVFATAHVRHSQSVSASNLLPWIAAEKDGSVLCAHCTCMAGLGEACAHIAGLLFALVSRTASMQEKACTSGPCQWVAPTMQRVEYARVAEIDFTAPSTKQDKSSQPKSPAATAATASQSRPAGACAPTPSELNDLFTRLASVSKPAVLSIAPGFSDPYVPVKPSGLPSLLTHLYDDAMLGVQFTDLLAKCEEVFNTISVTEAEARALEEGTRDQANCKDWFRYRAGRITASKMRAAAHTDVSQPSSSLVRSICYPEAHRFSTSATRWGCKHESGARDSYMTSIQGKHTNFKVTDSGLVIPISHPYIGATPDGKVSCDCCGEGVLEVKCPFSCRDTDFSDAAESTKFCLEKCGDGFQLKCNHSYYYQVQAQLFATRAKYCDFVVWREEQCVVLRIQPDPSFIENMLTAVTAFFKLGVMPELLGKWFTKSFSVLPGPLSDCTCMQEKEGPIAECAREECNVRRYHLVCLG